MTDRQELPPPAVSFRRIAVRLGVIVLIVLAVQWMLARAMPEAAVSEGMLHPGMLAATLLIYAVLIAIPFVPGIEIGATLLIIGGAQVAPFVYIATLGGLGLAFLVGVLISYDWLHKVFADLRMRRMCVLLEDMKPLSREKRLALLRRRLPRWADPVALHGRYLLLAALLLVPGNAVIGGGGGICLVAGVSRLYRPSLALLTIALAVLPIPLAVWLFGAEVPALF